MNYLKSLIVIFFLINGLLLGEEGGAAKDVVESAEEKIVQDKTEKNSQENRVENGDSGKNENMERENKKSEQNQDVAEQNGDKANGAEQASQAAPQPQIAEQAPQAAPQPQTAEQAPQVAPQPQIAEQAPQAAPQPQTAEQAPQAAPQPQIAEQAPQAAPQPQTAEQAPQAAPQPQIAEQAPQAAPQPQTAEAASNDEEKSDLDKIREIEKTFWKGEIANIGANEIISPYNNAGVAAGIKLMDDDLYLLIDPKFSMQFEKIGAVNGKNLGLIFGFHAPLNIMLVTTDINNNDGNVKFRTEDWDEWQDYLKILRYIQIGNSEDNLYFSIGSNFAQTIGHGTILKRYVPNHDLTFSTLSAKLNWYFDYGGFELLLGDVARGNMAGGIVFVKPFAGIDNYHARSASFGYSFAADRNAPTSLRYVDYYDYSAEDYFSGRDDRVPRIANDSKGRPIVEESELLYVQGIDFEVKLFKNAKADLKVFTDYSWFGTKFERGGFTFGFLGRFNLDDKNRHAFRMQFEGRAHHESYLPSFFDTFYDIERFEMMTNVYGVDNFQPDGKSKYWHLANDSSDKFIGSFYGELAYSWKTWLALSLGYEQFPKSASLFAHLELPDLWIFKMMLSYYKRGIASPSDVFSDDKVSSLFRAVVRLQILPFMYINAYAGKHWTFWSAKNPRPNDNYEGHYVSSWDVGGDIEFGWEWGRAGREKEKKAPDKEAPDKEAEQQ